MIDIQRVGRTTVDGWDVSTIVFNGRQETIAFGPQGQQVDIFAATHDEAVERVREMLTANAMAAVERGEWEEA